MKGHVPKCHAIESCVFGIRNRPHPPWLFALDVLSEDPVPYYITSFTYEYSNWRRFGLKLPRMGKKNKNVARYLIRQCYPPHNYPNAVVRTGKGFHRLSTSILEHVLLSHESLNDHSSPPPPFIHQPPIVHQSRERNFTPNPYKKDPVYPPTQRQV